jgi:hypothetical protein
MAYGMYLLFKSHELILTFYTNTEKQNTPKIVTMEKETTPKCHMCQI